MNEYVKIALIAALVVYASNRVASVRRLIG